MTIYIGLDVHGKMTVYVAQNDQGKLVGQGQVQTTGQGLDQLLGGLAAPPGTPIALESGTQADWVAQLLEERGMAPVVVNAREVRAKARNPRQKTDRREAFELCDGLRRDQWVSLVWVPSPTIARLRAILSRRRHFVAQATRQTNAAKFPPRPKRMARILWRMWREGKPFDPGRLNVEPVHKVKSRIVHWEIPKQTATVAV